MSSPLRPVLVNKTNASQHPGAEFKTTGFRVAPPQSERKRPFSRTKGDADSDVTARKRVKVYTEEVIDVDAYVEEGEDDHEDNEDSEDDVEDASYRPQDRAPRYWSTYNILSVASRARPGRGTAQLPLLSTRPILQSFVSSNKCDIFKLHATRNTSYVSPPYACSYSHAARTGQNSLLAVTTEEGAVHILDTSKRREWDVEPQRHTFQPHDNGVFDVQWCKGDTHIATASADKSVCVSKLSSSGATPTVRLSHHSNTVKCVAWDPTREGDILVSGSRDGMICVWDLRLATGASGGEGLKPVIAVPKAHDTGKATASRKKMTAPPARGVTSLLFSDHDPYALISSGSYDGILRQWDIRYIDAKRRSTRKEPTVKSITSPVDMSSTDPTLYCGTRRARGITSMTAGTGVTAGLLFALSNDSRIHTYDMTTLEPLSGHTSGPETDAWSYTHENMHTNSFYIRLAMSPCGKWLASGGARNGSAYLFDVSGSTRARIQPSLYADGRGRGIELNGQKGEVGAVDWAAGNLATCADDGTVRMWRPDMERYRECQAQSEDMSWHWCWAKEQ